MTLDHLVTLVLLVLRLLLFLHLVGLLSLSSSDWKRAYDLWEGVKDLDQFAPSWRGTPFAANLARMALFHSEVDKYHQVIRHSSFHGACDGNFGNAESHLVVGPWCPMVST